MNQKLIKLNKLKNSSLIRTLFSYGIWLIEEDLKLIYKNIHNSKESFNFKCGISISKKNIKKAVDRNKIKRLLRECIRLNKLYLLKSKKLIFILIYKSNTVKKFHELQIQYLKIIQRIE